MSKCEGGGLCGAWWQSSCLALHDGVAPGSSRQPIWCGGCREVGSGEGAAPHRPAINHSYVARGQGVGRGQGAASAAHTGQGKGARVRCGCKLSPKCFQAKANQGTVTEHTRPHPAPASTLTSVQAHIHSCSACRAVHTKVSHPDPGAQRRAHQTCCCCPEPTHTETALHPLSFI